LLGIHNPASPALIQNLGAKAVRFIIDGYNDPQTRSHGIAKCVEFKQGGYIVMATLKNVETNQTGLAVPDSTDWNATLAALESFLRGAAGSVDYCSLDNEPELTLPAIDFESQGTNPSPAIVWFSALASRARGVVNSDPTLSHIKICSPANLNVFTTNGPGWVLRRWAEEDPNIDVIDTHQHVVQASDIEDALAAIQQETHKAVVITEWSQARVAYPWLGDTLDAAFAAQWNVQGPRLNSDFVAACYTNRVGKAEWDQFVAMAPYDSSFMQAAFVSIVRHGVTVATYGADTQYGDVNFDTKQLLATMTVVTNSTGLPQENYLFANWYRGLATAYNNGLLKTGGK